MGSTLVRVPTATAPERRSEAVRRRRRARSLLGMAYAAPTAVLVAVFFLVPLVLVVWMSANRWPLLGGRQAVNLPDNYTAVPDTPLLSDALVFTLKYTAIITVVLFGIALALAMMVQDRRPGVSFLRTAYFLPSAVGLASASLLFYGLFSNNIGPLDGIAHRLGLADGPVSWIGTPNHALASAIVMITWRFAGFYMLILLTGLSAIPMELYEAARVDGANRWQTFWRVTVPLLRPTFALMLILIISGSLLAFDQFYILTNGGPDNSTVSVVMVIYREAFTRFNLGSAAAISVIVLVALVALNTVQLAVLRRDDD